MNAVINEQLYFFDTFFISLQKLTSGIINTILFDNFILLLGYFVDFFCFLFVNLSAATHGATHYALCAADFF